MDNTVVVMPSTVTPTGRYPLSVYYTSAGLPESMRTLFPDDASAFVWTHALLQQANARSLGYGGGVMSCLPPTGNLCCDIAVSPLCVIGCV